MFRMKYNRYQEATRISGGMTGTLFPKTEKRLLEEAGYLEAFILVTRRKKMDKYRSIIDFLLCETFPNKWRYRCALYYNNRGPALCGIKGFDARFYDNLLCNLVLGFCKKATETEEDTSWAKVHKNINRIILKTTGGG